MTEIEMVTILERFATAFEKFKISQDVITLWTEIFADYDFDLVKKAADRVIETCQYAPKPYDLKSAINFLKDSGSKIPAFQCTPEERKTYRDYLATKGIRVLPDGQYAREDEIHGNEKKIDYVCRILGGETVTAMLKEALGGSIFNVDSKKYNEFLNTVLIPMAEHDERNPAKSWVF